MSFQEFSRSQTSLLDFCFLKFVCHCLFGKISENPSGQFFRKLSESVSEESSGKNRKYFPESFKNSRKFFRGVFSGIFKEYFCRIFLQSFLKKPFRKIPFFRSVHYRPFDQITMAKPARIDG